jgi:hypothetical protein
LTADSTAYSAWQGLKHFFTENAEGHEIYVDKKFQNTLQGDMTVVVYCRKMKAIADQLSDVGAPVTDKLFTVICGPLPPLASLVTNIILLY